MYFKQNKSQEAMEYTGKAGVLTGFRPLSEGNGPAGRSATLSVHLSVCWSGFDYLLSQLPK